MAQGPGARFTVIGGAMAGSTGRLIAERATGLPTTVDLAPFRSDRV
jgi:hypothetical protein